MRGTSWESETSRKKTKLETWMGKADATSRGDAFINISDD
jgi:hypothetical protein